MELMLPHISQMNANATHYGLLAAMVARTTGPVLELGVGHYSTPMLHFMCQGRSLTSVDTSTPWDEFFRKQFANYHHTFVCTNGGLISEAIKAGAFKDQYDVVFIDNGPEPNRVKCLEYIRSQAKFIVVHDAEPQAAIYGWGDIFKTFPHRYYWDFYGNGTMVLSDREGIKFE